MLHRSHRGYQVVFRLASPFCFRFVSLLPQCLPLMMAQSLARFTVSGSHTGIRPIAFTSPVFHPSTFPAGGGWEGTDSKNFAGNFLSFVPGVSLYHDSLFHFLGNLGNRDIDRLTIVSFPVSPTMGATALFFLENGNGVHLLQGFIRGGTRIG